jgi:hypothetical protein
MRSALELPPACLLGWNGKVLTVKGGYCLLQPSLRSEWRKGLQLPFVRDSMTV